MDDGSIAHCKHTFNVETSGNAHTLSTMDAKRLEIEMWDPKQCGLRKRHTYHHIELKSSSTRNRTSITNPNLWCCRIAGPEVMFDVIFVSFEDKYISSATRNLVVRLSSWAARVVFLCK